MNVIAALSGKDKEKQHVASAYKIMILVNPREIIKASKAVDKSNIVAMFIFPLI